MKERTEFDGLKTMNWIRMKGNEILRMANGKGQLRKIKSPPRRYWCLFFPVFV